MSIEQEDYWEMPYLGEIRMWAGTYLPKGWAYCHGQTLKIVENPALYSLLSNTYGGTDETFNLPDLRGRVPLGMGQLKPYFFLIGKQGGAETIVLKETELPAHSHSFSVTNEPAELMCVNENKQSRLAKASTTSYYTKVDNDIERDSLFNTLSLAGGGKEHLNMMPFTVVSFIICTNGLYPSFS